MTIMMQWVVFAVGTLILWWWSRKPLQNKKSHGFFRFFAWVCMLGILVLNVPVWGQNPGTWHGTISTILLAFSIVFVLLGLYTMNRYGKASQTRNDEELYGFERTTALVTKGIFRYVRHPLFASLIYLTWGAFFQMPQLLVLILACVATYFLYRAARADEYECTEYFGSEYQNYMQHSKMFVPWLV